MLDIPHVRQSNQKRNCGAACLSMVLAHCNKSGKINEITKEISVLMPNGLPSCRNYLMVQYALKRGLHCSVVSAKDMKSFLPFCLAQGLYVMVSFHPRPRSLQGHFSLVTGIEEPFVFMNDPLQNYPDGKNYRMDLDALIASMQSHPEKDDEITRSNACVVIAKNKSNLPVQFISSNGQTFPIFTCILEQITAFVDPFKDDWISVDALSTSTAVNPF